MAEDGLGSGLGDGLGDGLGEELFGRGVNADAESWLEEGALVDVEAEARDMGEI